MENTTSTIKVEIQKAENEIFIVMFEDGITDERRKEKVQEILERLAKNIVWETGVFCSPNYAALYKSI